MKTAKKILISTVILALLASLVPALALGSPVIGEDTAIGSGTALSEWVYYDSEENETISENYIQYTPSSEVSPLAAYGSKLYGTSTYESIASYLENQGYTLVAAINGDYFNTTTGLPNGIVITEGILRGSDGGQYAVGFTADGEALIGKPAMTISLAGPDGTIGLSAVNRALSASYGGVLYTDDFSANTRSSLAAKFIALTPDGSDELRLGSSLTATVSSVTDSSSAVSIPEGKMVLAIAESSVSQSSYSYLSGLEAGDSVTIKLGCASGWDKVEYAVGAYYELVSDGEPHTFSDTTAAPRTAVGVKSDGTVVFYTVDGRQTGLSDGLSYDALAERMADLGCVTAVNLDGGGSTVMAVSWPGLDGMDTVNSPSEGSLRKCANYIFLVNTSSSYGSAKELGVYPDNSLVLAGASLEYEAGAFDRDYLTVPLDEEPEFYSNVGEMDGNIFTAGSRGGEGYVSAEADGLEGEAAVTVVDEPDSLAVINGSTGKAVSSSGVTVGAGKTLKFKASAFFDHRPVICSDELFDWSVSGGIGSVSSSGLFTAAALGEQTTGALTLSYGSVSATVSITVGGSLEMLTFENSSGAIASAENIAFSVNADLLKVKYGFKSGKIAYNTASLQKGDSLIAPYSKSLGNAEYLNIWVYGDGSGNTLVARLVSSSETTLQSLAVLNYTGWKYVSIAIPSGAGELSGLGVKLTGNTGASYAVYLDNLTLAASSQADVTPPVISADLEEGSPVINIKDSGGVLFSSAITVRLDGKALDFEYDNSTGEVYLELGSLSGSHRLTITAFDVYGNISRRVLSVGDGENEQPFDDMSGHWADEFTRYLYMTGLSAGYIEGEQTLYKPQRNISRAEFAVMMCRFLGISAGDYASVTLPFADASSLPAWAENEIKAMYSLGVITGSTDSSGKTYFKPSSSLTRAQAMAMLGRTLPMGYEKGELTFSDSASVPDWALPYIQELMALEVVSGSDGKVSPDGLVTRAQIAKMFYALGI